MLFKKVLISLGAAGALGSTGFGIYKGVKRTEEKKPTPGNSAGGSDAGASGEKPPAVSTGQKNTDSQADSNNVADGKDLKKTPSNDNKEEQIDGNPKPANPGRTQDTHFSSDT